MIMMPMTLVHLCFVLTGASVSTFEVSRGRPVLNADRNFLYSFCCVDTGWHGIARDVQGYQLSSFFCKPPRAREAAGLTFPSQPSSGGNDSEGTSRSRARVRATRAGCNTPNVTLCIGSSFWGRHRVIHPRRQKERLVFCAQVRVFCFLCQGAQRVQL